VHVWVDTVGIHGAEVWLKTTPGGATITHPPLSPGYAYANSGGYNNAHWQVWWDSGYLIDYDVYCSGAVLQ
jgi:hypothetical protein